jgi:hypothetical protein
MPDYVVAQALPEIRVECYAGTGLEFSVPVLGAAGAPVNMVNLLGARAQVRTRWESVEVLHSWTTDTPAGMTLGGGANAAVTIMATGQETATWQAQWAVLDAVWDLEVVDSDGEPHRLCRLSPFIVYPEVTREL